MDQTVEQRRAMFEILYKWNAPERHWEPKDRAWFVGYGTFFVIIIAALAILQEYMFILAVIAFVFLWFTQALIPPEITTHTVTSIGIKAYGKMYKWDDIEHYWFSRKGDVTYLNIDVLTGDLVRAGRRQRLSLIMDEMDSDTLFYGLLNYIDYGDKDEINYNFLTQLLHGKYVDISYFLPEDVPDQETYIDLQNKDANASIVEEVEEEQADLSDKRSKRLKKK